MMIRSVSQNLKPFLNCNRFLCPFALNAPIVKRLQSTDVLENSEKCKSSQFEELKKFRQAEVHLWHSFGTSINPELLTEEQWQHIYELEAKHQRKRYCRYLSKKLQVKSEKKEKLLEEREAKKGNREKIIAEREANTHIVYGVGHNSLMLRVNSQTINKWLNRKLHWAKLFGQKMVIDCSFESYMTDLERNKVAKQLKRLYTENRKHKQPMDLHLCNVEPNSVIMKNLSGQVPTLLSKSSPTSIHQQCFMELFPKERLVMLTPDSDNILQYDFDDVYIIGGIVDYGRNDPLTMAKAKKLGIRTARLPLDTIRLGEGDTKQLTLTSAAAFIRESQLNDNIQEIIQKTVYLKSWERQRREEEKYREILEQTQLPKK